MQKTLDLIRAFARDEDGVTAIEYGLLAALIAVMVIGGATVAGTSLNSIFTYIGTELNTANGNKG
ncbi:Flp pilus assembly protein, pilin Flp [Paraburkholderia piptadeniae]|uniref:Flp pilus assembly protein, pilin Flp n=1 Tax=Paraburkholderia piptadeniae TaxID=1701573 RepID=A0A1N7SRT0_9BURK|nr:Flp family type IVb pilin [Paraburkholderia piptadeniae]SIT50171.1 Flp pilus assembly protein, pilin Flp [Paraburkholderia piptadeniae]